MWAVQLTRRPGTYRGLSPARSMEILERACWQQRVHSHRGTNGQGRCSVHTKELRRMVRKSQLLAVRRRPCHALSIKRLSCFPKTPQCRGDRSCDIPPSVGSRYSFLLGPVSVFIGICVLCLGDGCLRCAQQNVFESSISLARKPSLHRASAAVSSFQANARVTPQRCFRAKALRGINVRVKRDAPYPTHAWQRLEPPNGFFLLGHANQSGSQALFLRSE